MQGLLAALRQHRRPRGKSRDLPSGRTSSAFYSPKGKEVEAPVLGDLPRLPTPFGTLLYTSPYFTQLSVEDRISALPLALDLPSTTPRRSPTSSTTTSPRETSSSGIR